MATMELVEKLREKTNVSYEDAKAALDACGDDLLDAVIYLERQGKINAPQRGGHYSSQYEQKQEDGDAAGTKTPSAKGERFSDMLRRFWKWCCKALRKGNCNHFEVSRKGERVLSIPITLLVILLLVAFPFSLAVVLLGLFFGFRYRLHGPDFTQTPVNDVMDSAAKAAVSAVETIKTELDGLSGPKDQ